MASLIHFFREGCAFTVGGVAAGFEALAVADTARLLYPHEKDAVVTLAVVARDSTHMQRLETALQILGVDLDVLTFPAWDCVPYDRTGPSALVASARMTALAQLARMRGGSKPRVLLTTAQSLLQRVPPRLFLLKESLALKVGQALDDKELVRWLETNGYTRTTTVREAGDYAVRGGLIDLFPASLGQPVRLDFFGAVLESIRIFDEETQRTLTPLRSLELVPSSELLLTSENLRRFRQGYLSQFSGKASQDVLFQRLSEGLRIQGADHWLPLFYEGMDTLFAYTHGARWLLMGDVETAIQAQCAYVEDSYKTRYETLQAEERSGSSGGRYRPLPPSFLYQSEQELLSCLEASCPVRFLPEGGQIDLGARAVHSFAQQDHHQETSSVFDRVVEALQSHQRRGQKVVLAGWTAGSSQRLMTMLKDHGLQGGVGVASWREVLELPTSKIAHLVLPLEQGFETDQLVVYSEQDILGERLSRRQRRSRTSKEAVFELQGLQPGDLVVHVDHGIGRFVGLKTLDVLGASHDCVELHYHGQDKLFVPVENMDLLSRYGSEDAEVALDKLGSPQWQARKRRMRERIRDMAQHLMRVAAERTLLEAPKLVPAEGLYDEFCARFPFEETDDQLRAIDAVLSDMASGRPMDRLVCGDVGFGKTEVALRAAFVAAASGLQVAVVVPTTLLARQHYRVFADRFRDMPMVVRQASRLVSAADLKATKEGLADGSVDLVVGTHALLGKGVGFKRLGLVIVDEEQHFGVVHKERLKQLSSTTHVLTLTATPIPRTLQLAMTGLRDMSIIATPPVDRLAVRTSVIPFDPLLVRDALMRERFRGGQSFFVCPRIEDLSEAKAFLEVHVPELKSITAHGQMSPSDIEERIGAFYDGEYDVLLSTTIVESGLDIPRANTLIVYRADRFGLAQLYQLRGRVGRSKPRAYALLTLQDEDKITEGARKRLDVLQSLDTLGAGFQVASHDLDQRGAGNLLGDEQSGHVKDVGFELYQQMLSETIELMKTGALAPLEDKWSPQINLGTTVMIPEAYVPDLALRLELYRRLAGLLLDADIEAFAAEMTDRFGPPPREVDHLLQTVRIKALCRRAHVDRVEAGPKGLLISFRDQSFANPTGLVAHIAAEGPRAKVRPDMKVFYVRDLPNADARLKTALSVLKKLVQIAEERSAA